MYVGCRNTEDLNPDQLAAVLEHEAAHMRRRDPLRLSGLRFIVCLLYWIPLVRRLASDLAESVEFIADDTVREPTVLASAILTIARSTRPGIVPVGGVGFHSPDLLDRRVRRLLGQRARPCTHVTRM